MDFCPYVGLEPFTEEHRDYFFGRERECRVIAANLYAAPLTVLYGPSGVGKSSLLRAGVVPHVQQARHTTVVYFNSWHDAECLELLKGACAGAVGLELDPGLRFDRFLDEIEQRTSGSLLLLLDQFEEFFLYHDGPSSFDAEFARAVNRDGANTGMLLALREDWLSRLDRFRSRIPRLLANTLRLEHLSRDAAEQAIRRPLAVFNQRFPEKAVAIEDALVTGILDQVRAENVTPGGGAAGGSSRAPDASPPIETSFLQLVLTRLWQEDAASGNLRSQTLERLGGAHAIVQRHLADHLQRLTFRQRSLAARMFRYLVTPSGTKVAHAVPDLVSFAEAPEAEVTPVLRTLAAARLLRRLDQPERYEIFHDVLARAVLEWRTGHDRDQLRRRYRRRMAVMAAVVFAAFLLVYYAFQKRAEAERAQVQAEQAEAETAKALGEAKSERDKAEAAATAEAEQRSKAELALSAADIAARLALARQLASVPEATDEERIRLARTATLLTLPIPSGVPPDISDVLRRAVRPEALPLDLPGHFSAVKALAFSPDGTRLASADSNELRLFGIPGGKGYWVAKPSWPCERLSFSRNGSVVTCASHLQVELFDTADGRLRFDVHGARGWNLNNAALSPDGQFLAVCRAGLEVLDTRDKSVVFSTDRADHFALYGDWLVLARGDVLSLWDFRRRTQLASPLVFPSAITGLDISPDGSTLLVALQSTAQFHDLPSLQIRRPQFLPNPSDRVEGLTYSADGKHLVSSRGDVFDLGGLHLFREQFPFVVSSDFKATADEASLRLTPIREGLSAFDIPGASDPASAAQFSSDSRHLLTGSPDGRLQVWDSETRRLQHASPALNGPLSAVAIAGDNSHFAAFTRTGELMLWRPDSSDPPKLHRLPGQFAFQLAFSPDSRRLAVGLYNGGLHILDPDNPQPVDLLPHESVFAVAFSPSGRRLAAGGFARALIWDLRDLSLKPETVPAPAVHGLSFAAEDSLFVAHTSGASMLQRGRRSELAAWSITRSSREIIPPALSPDSSLVAFAPLAGTVVLFDTRALQPVTTLYAPENSVIRSIAFTPDSRTLVALDQSWKLYRFPVPFEALLREATRRSPEPLTDDDCERYLRQRPCPAQIAALRGKQ